MLGPSYRLPLFLLVMSAGALGTALVAQHLFGLAPCILCIYQRWPYGIAMAICLAAMAIGGRRPRGLLVLAAGGVLAAGAGIAAYHVGVEQGWWAGTAQCGGTLPRASSVEDLRRMLEATQPVSCDRPAFTLFGVSMAGFNLALALGLTAVAITGARPMLRRTA